MCPLPLPPRRSRERPRRPRLPRGGLTVCLPPPPQRLCREHMPRPVLRPRARTMCPLSLPPRRSREHPRRPRLPRRDLRVHPPPPQRLCREHMPRPLLLPSGHTTCPRRLPRGRTGVCTIRSNGARIPLRDSLCRRCRAGSEPAGAAGVWRRHSVCRCRSVYSLSGHTLVLPSYDIPDIIRAPRLGRVPCPSGAGEPSFYFLDGVNPFGSAARGLGVGWNARAGGRIPHLMPTSCGVTSPS